MQLMILSKEQEDEITKREFDALEHEFYERYVECFIGVSKDDPQYDVILEQMLPYLEAQNLYYWKSFDLFMKGCLIIAEHPEPELKLTIRARKRTEYVAFAIQAK